MLVVCVCVRACVHTCVHVCMHITSCSVYRLDCTCSVSILAKTTQRLLELVMHLQILLDFSSADIVMLCHVIICLSPGMLSCYGDCPCHFFMQVMVVVSTTLLWMKCLEEN